MRRISTLAAAALCAACSGEPARLRVLAPASTPAYTNGTVAFVLAPDGFAPTAVDLIVDGTLHATRSSPPWEFTLDTRGMSEARHEVYAVGRSPTGSVTSRRTALVVDRYPPQIESYRPAEWGSSLFDGRPLEIVFSEPVLIAEPPGIRLVAGDAPVPATVVASGSTLRIEPAATEVSKVSPEVAGRITDRAGNALLMQPFWGGFAYPFTPLARSTAMWEVSGTVNWLGEGLLAITGAAPDDQLVVAGDRFSDWTRIAASPYLGASTAYDGELLLATSQPVRVRRWTGAALVPVGPEVVPSGGPVSLHDDSFSGRLLLAWSDWDDEVHVAAWDLAASAFSEDFPPVTVAGRCVGARVQVAGRVASPVVRVQHFPCEGGVGEDDLFTWDGVAWIPAPLPAATPHTLVGGPGVAAAALQNSYPSPRIFSWDGAAWQEPWPAPDVGAPAALAFDATGHPILVHTGWPDGLGVVRHDGTRWVTVAPPGTVGTSWINVAAIAPGPGNTALVAWIEGAQTLAFARWISW